MRLGPAFQMICQHFGSCGGCQWQDVRYADQLDRKRQHVQALFDGVLRRTVDVRPTLGTPVQPDGMPWHFRHKVTFVFGPDPRSRDGLVMGHFAAGSKRIVPVRECPVHPDRANRLAFALRDYLLRARLPAAGPRLDGIVRHILIRTSRDEREAIVMLVVTANDRRLRAPLRAFLAGPERPDGLFVNINDRPGPYMVGEETLRIDGRAHVRETLGGTSFLVSPTAFFQTNPHAATILLDEVLDQVPADRGTSKAEPLLDLYAGSGLFALPLASRGHVVLAVEDNAQAVRDAEANRRLNGIAPDRLQFLRSRVDDVLPRLERTRARIVVLDPPRQGCPGGVLDAIFHRLAPERAVYVSCNPEALAVELPAIIAGGYRVSRVQPIDMFPHTAHVEVVATIDRR